MDDQHRPPDLPAVEALISELRDAVRARDDFIAVASHELRNPMTPVLSQVELLQNRARREGASPALQAGLDRLTVAIRRYVRRATMLLDVSRVNAGRVSLNAVPLDLAAAVREVAADHVLTAQRAGSHLSLRLPDALPGAWDALAVEQIVENLIGNAVRYGRGRPIEVTLEVLDDAAVALTVRDEGDGIAECDLPRLFGRFEQVVQRREQGGFGIGLWLTNRLAEAMGGSISVTSQVGVGSVFTVRLPRDVTSAGEVGI